MWQTACSKSGSSGNPCLQSFFCESHAPGSCRFRQHVFVWPLVSSRTLTFSGLVSTGDNCVIWARPDQHPEHWQGAVLMMSSILCSHARRPQMTSGCSSLPPSKLECHFLLLEPPAGFSYTPYRRAEYATRQTHPPSPFSTNTCLVATPMLVSPVLMLLACCSLCSSS